MRDELGGLLYKQNIITSVTTSMRFGQKTSFQSHRDGFLDRL